jgi:hypothetical protein
MAHIKVLLATDGSDQATIALTTTARLLQREDSEFDLFNAHCETLKYGGESYHSAR